MNENVTETIVDALPTVDIKTNNNTAVLATGVLAGFVATSAGIVLIKKYRAKKAAEKVEVVTD